MGKLNKKTKQYECEFIKSNSSVFLIPLIGSV